jgi:hypothetical protein
MRSALFALLAVAIAPVAANDVPEVRARPSEGCVDARAVVSARPLAADALLVIESDGRSSKLHFDAQCLGEAGLNGDLKLLAPQGFACPGALALLRRRPGLPDCPVLGVETLDARTLAAALGASAEDPTLAPIDVRGGQSTRAFSGTHAHCFAERYAIGYSEDDEGLIVRVRPKRSGGYSRYRVVLENACPALSRWYSIGFRSGANNGVICGHAGDAVVEEDEFDQSLLSSETSSSGAAQLGERCAIREVYPLPG